MSSEIAEASRRPCRDHGRGGPWVLPPFPNAIRAAVACTFSTEDPFFGQHGSRTSARVRRATATWTYRDEAGRVMRHVLRFETADGGKDIRPVTLWRASDGRLSWKFGAGGDGRPLYGLDRLSVRPEAPVLMVEGEKTADAAQARFPWLVAMTWPGGSNALVIAKLDRLARSVAFVSRLQEDGVDFVAADMPHANTFTIQIIAAMAEFERKLISERTVAALKAAKAKGIVLGGRRIGHRIEDHSGLGRVRSAAVRSAKARVRALDCSQIIASIQSEGTSTLSGIAGVLNARGIPAARGGEWSAGQVGRIVAATRVD